MVTTIQVEKATAERLKYHKRYTKESYDEVINQMIDQTEEQELKEEALLDIRTSLEEVKTGKGTPIEEFAKELGIEL